jgi:hypothetical protein
MFLANTSRSGPFRIGRAVCSLPVEWHLSHAKQRASVRLVPGVPRQPTATVHTRGEPSPAVAHHDLRGGGAEIGSAATVCSSVFGVLAPAAALAAGPGWGSLWWPRGARFNRIPFLVNPTCAGTSLSLRAFNSQAPDAVEKQQRKMLQRVTVFAKSSNRPILPFAEDNSQLPEGACDYCDEERCFLMDTLGYLLCGHDSAAEGFAKSALDQLSRSIDAFSRRAITFLKESATEDTFVFGPFCARVLLENSCAALIGRLDCFRMMYLSEFQAQPQYEYGKRAKSAFSWVGDVIPEDKPSPNIWSLDHDVSKITRALYSRHFEHVFWRPAVNKMLDFVSNVSDPALSEIFALDAENYINEAKGRSLQLYATLSKGVHWEFFTSVLVFDEPTVKTAIRDTCLLVGHLGLTSHFIPTAYASLSPNDALNSYLLFRRELP